MSIYILLNNPIRKELPKTEEKYFLDTFLKKSFPLNSEFPLIQFNSVFIRLDICWSLSENIYRLIDLLSNIQKNNEGTEVMRWYGGEFNSMWTLTWTENTITITTEWGEIYPPQLSQVLDANSSCEMKKDEFMYEWKVLFNFIIKSIENSEVEIDDNYFPILKTIETRIPLFGKYYGHLNEGIK